MWDVYGLFEADLCHPTWVLSQGFEQHNNVSLQRGVQELQEALGSEAQMYEHSFSVQMCVFDVSRQPAKHTGAS